LVVGISLRFCGDWVPARLGFNRHGLHHSQDSLLGRLRRAEHLRLTQRSQCWMPTIYTWRVNNPSDRRA
jgi:hypothetical protein